MILYHELYRQKSLWLSQDYKCISYSVLALVTKRKGTLGGVRVRDDAFGDVLHSSPPGLPAAGWPLDAALCSRLLLLQRNLAGSLQSRPRRGRLPLQMKDANKYDNKSTCMD